MKNPKKIQCGIYAIENRSDGKRYYGSSRDILLRIKQHIYSLRRNVHHSQKLQHAWNKYKEENFSFILVKEIDVSTVDLNLLNDVLVQLEQFYINRDNTCSKNGYNMVLPDKRTGIKVKPDINEELMPNTKYYKSKDPRFVELRAFVPLECAEKFKNIRDSENLDNNTAMEEIVLEYCI
ncbi:MAG TPA: GIY-YIG nuclease family protein, partial [Phormidium sp.]